MPPIIDTKIIFFILAFIAVGIITYFLVKYFKKRAEEKFANSAIGSDHTPTKPTKEDVKKLKDAQLKGKTSLALLGTTAKEISKYAEEIKNSINTFSQDDITSIISTLKNIRTKSALSLLVKYGNELYKFSLYDVIRKNLSGTELGKLTKWMDNLPEYV